MPVEGPTGFSLPHPATAMLANDHSNISADLITGTLVSLVALQHVPCVKNYSRPVGKSTVNSRWRTDKMSAGWSHPRSVVYFLAMLAQFFSALAITAQLWATSSGAIWRPGPRPLSAFERRKAEALFRSRLPCLGCH